MSGLWLLPFLLSASIQSIEVRRVKSTWEIIIQATEPIPYRLFPVHEPYQGLVIDLPGENLDVRAFRRLPGRGGIRRVTLTRFREITRMVRIFVETAGDFTFTHEQAGKRLTIWLTVQHTPEPLRPVPPLKKPSPPLKEEKAAARPAPKPRPVDLKLVKTPPQVAVQAFSLATGVTLEVVGSLEGKPPVDLDLKGEPLEKALEHLAEALGAQVEKVSPGHYRLRL